MLISFWYSFSIGTHSNIPNQNESKSFIKEYSGGGVNLESENCKIIDDSYEMILENITAPSAMYIVEASLPKI